MPKVTPKKPILPGISPTKKFTSLVIGEETYSLLFDLNGLALAESLCDVNLLSTIDMTDLNVSKLRGMFFATLLRAHPEMTIEMAGDLMMQVGINKASKALIETWKAAQPPADPNQPTEDNAAPANE